MILRCSKSETGQTADYQFQRGLFSATHGEERTAILLVPELRFYPSHQSETTEASIQSGMLANLYINIGEQGGNSWPVHLYYHPLVVWIWIGALFMAAGGAMSWSTGRLWALLKLRLPISAPSCRSGIMGSAFMKRLLVFIPLVIFAGFAIALGLGLSNDPTHIPSVLIDKPMPQFTLSPVLPGQPGFTRADLDGQVSLVNVFGSWCAVCEEEHPTLMMLAKNKCGQDLWHRLEGRFCGWRQMAV